MEGWYFRGRGGGRGGWENSAVLVVVSCAHDAAADSGRLLCHHVRTFSVWSCREHSGTDCTELPDKKENNETFGLYEISMTSVRWNNDQVFLCSLSKCALFCYFISPLCGVWVVDSVPLSILHSTLSQKNSFLTISFFPFSCLFWIYKLKWRYGDVAWLPRVMK